MTFPAALLTSVACAPCDAHAGANGIPAALRSTVACAPSDAHAGSQRHSGCAPLLGRLRSLRCSRGRQHVEPNRRGPLLDRPLHRTGRGHQPACSTSPSGPPSRAAAGSSSARWPGYPRRRPRRHAHSRARARRSSATTASTAASPAAVAFCIRQARENARTIRDAVPTEMWEALNTWHLQVSAAAPGDLIGGGAHAFLSTMRSRAYLFSGCADATMVRTEGWQWLMVGRWLERLSFTCRVLGVHGEELTRVETAATGRPPLPTAGPCCSGPSQRLRGLPRQPTGPASRLGGSPSSCSSTPTSRARCATLPVASTTQCRLAVEDSPTHARATARRAPAGRA